MNEKRRHERYPDSLAMDIMSPTGEIQTFVTRDISSGGIFVLAKYHDQLPLGAEVTITSTSHAHDQEPPTMRGRVVRRNGQGMGIEFLDSEFT